MEILNGLDALPSEPIEPVLTLGSFDGVHRGHQALLGRLREESSRVQAPTMVLTFHPHPRQYLSQDAALLPLMSLKERIHRLWDLEIDYALILPFDADLAEMTAKEFVTEILWDALRVNSIYVGPYLSFGHDRGGDVRLLQSSASPPRASAARSPEDSSRRRPTSWGTITSSPAPSSRAINAAASWATPRPTSHTTGRCCPLQGSTRPGSACPTARATRPS